jgi:plasmid stability protein
MTSQTLTLNVPERLYSRLRERARQTNRSIEAEMLEVLATAVPADEDLPADLAQNLSSLSGLDDESLWQAARSHFATEALGQLEELHHKRQREGLTEAEAQTLAGLIGQYERAMLVRAHATLLLKQRGFDVSNLAGNP